MNLTITFAKLQFGVDNRLRAYNKIAVMLDNGIGIDQVLSELYDRESDNGRKPGESMAIVYSEWRAVIQNGGRFADAIDGWIPIPERMILMAGERAGDLPKALRSVIRVVKASQLIRNTVLGGIMYPFILAIATLAYLYLFGAKVIPEFTRMLDAETWGSLAYSLYLMSEFVIKYGSWIIAGLVTFIALIIYSLPRWSGSLRTYADKLPPYSLYRLVIGSGFLLALSSMLGSNGRIQDALATLAKHANPYLAERLDAFLFGINSGLDAGEAMRVSGYDFPSKDLVGDLGVYARHSGDFSVAINKVAEEWMDSGLETVRSQMKVLSGLAMAFIGGTLAWIVAGFFAIQQEIAVMSKMAGG